MSQGNVEIVRKSMNAFAERDVEAMRELNDPEVELDWSASLGVEARVYQGIDSALRFWESYFQAFEAIVWEELSFIDAGEYVVAPNMSRSRGRNGIEVFARATFVFTLRDRKITRICFYQQHDEALKAAGAGGVAMSQENVETARRLNDVPLSQMSEMAIRSFFHPDVEFLPLRAATEGAYHGIAGIERFIADTGAVFEKFEPHYEYLDLDERVLAWGRIRVQARQSGIDTDIPVGSVLEFRDGKIVRCQAFGSKAEALKAAGLAE